MKFFKVITLLEPHEDDYRHSVDFYYYLGTACLYQDDRAGAKSYFDAARKITVSDLLVKCKLTASKGEAKRLIQQGGVTVDGEKVTDFNESYDKSRFTDGLKIKKGKKVFHKAIVQ